MWQKLKTLAACRYDYVTLFTYRHTLRPKHGFAQSRDCPVQTLDPWFVVQPMDWPRNPGIACAQSINQDNRGGTCVCSNKKSPTLIDETSTVNCTMHI